MSQRMKLFIFLLIINLIVVVFYLIWNYIRRKEKIGSVWMKAVMMLLCPVTGPAFVLLSFLLFKLFSSQGMDLSDVVFNKDRTENFLRPDEEMERNMVSLEEALEVTDKKSLRTLMLNVIRGDYRNSLAAINLALNSEDSETAHYAASVLQDVLNDFRSKVQTDYLLCQEENEQQVENCIKLVEYMNPILEQQVLTDLEQRSMAERMQEVLQKAWELDKIKISSTVYEKVCQRLLEVKDYEKCTLWCDRAMEQYPGALSSYTCQMKLYFSCGKKEKFFQVMQELRDSDITIDNETLELIRTFLITLRFVSIFAAYTGLTVLLPAIMFRRILAGRRLSEQFLMCYTFGNFYIINIVFAVQLLHISGFWTLVLFTAVPGILIWSRVNRVSLRELCMKTGIVCKKILQGSMGIKGFLYRVKNRSMAVLKKAVWF